AVVDYARPPVWVGAHDRCTVEAPLPDLDLAVVDVLGVQRAVDLLGRRLDADRAPVLDDQVVHVERGRARRADVLDGDLERLAVRTLPYAVGALLQSEPVE